MNDTMDLIFEPSILSSFRISNLVIIFQKCLKRTQPAKARTPRYELQNEGRIGGGEWGE